MTELRDYYFYIIYCKSNTSLSFIGKTISIDIEKRNHKARYSSLKSYKYYDNVKIYQSIRENGGWRNWIMEEISYQKRLTKLECKIIEQILINELGNLNDINVYTINT